MPLIDGIEVCSRIREQSNTPIIMITAKSEDADKILGLNSGADDYIIKSFSAGEVIARINAVLRRITPVENNNISIIKHLPFELYINKAQSKNELKLS